MNFEKFDKMFDVDQIQKDIEDINNNGPKQNYDDVPIGNYEVSISKMELVASKAEKPMVSVWFKILSGKYKNSLLFMNQVVTEAFQIHIMNNFLKSLKTEKDVKFESYTQYGKLIFDIYDSVEDVLEFELEYGEKKGYKTFTIKDVFEV